ARYHAAGETQVRVAAGVIAVMMRVDDVADRLVGELPDRGEDLVGERSELRVDDQHAVVADLHGNVAAGPDEHVDIVAHLKRPDLDGVEVLLRADRLRGREQDAGQRGERKHFACKFHLRPPPPIRSPAAAAEKYRASPDTRDTSSPHRPSRPRTGWRGRVRTR